MFGLDSPAGRGLAFDQELNEWSPIHAFKSMGMFVAFACV
jgi:hypothetical protein